MLMIIFSPAVWCPMASEPRDRPPLQSSMGRISPPVTGMWLSPHCPQGAPSPSAWPCLHLGGRQIPDPSEVFLLGSQPPRLLEPFSGIPPPGGRAWAPSAALILTSSSSNTAASLQLARPCRAVRTGVPVCANGGRLPGDRRLIIAQTKTAWSELF